MLNSEYSAERKTFVIAVCLLLPFATFLILDLRILVPYKLHFTKSLLICLNESVCLSKLIIVICLQALILNKYYNNVRYAQSLSSWMYKKSRSHPNFLISIVSALLVRVQLCFLVEFVVEDMVIAIHMNTRMDIKMLRNAVCLNL